MTKCVEAHAHGGDHLERVVVDVQRDPFPFLLLSVVESRQQALPVLVGLPQSFHGA